MRYSARRGHSLYNREQYAYGRQQIHKAKHDNGYVTKKIENFELPWFIPCYYMHLTGSVGEIVGEGPKSYEIYNLT